MVNVINVFLMGEKPFYLNFWKGTFETREKKKDPYYSGK